VSRLLQRVQAVFTLPATTNLTPAQTQVLTEIIADLDTLANLDSEQILSAEDAEIAAYAEAPYRDETHAVYHAHLTDRTAADADADESL
jgi:hypothetical protein